MPSSIFSHQAPGLLIKIKYPNRFDGTALCISGIVPDLGLIFELPFQISLRGITHSLLGLIVWTFPLTIILTILFCSYIGPLCAKIAKKNALTSRSLRYFGVDEWIYLKKKKYDIRFFIVAFYSTMIGGLTHLLLDLPSHGTIEYFYPWVILQSPDILLYSIIKGGTIYIGETQINTSFRIYHLIWIIETIITLIISLYLLRHIKMHNLISNWYKLI